MDILNERKEVSLARTINYAPTDSRVVLSQDQKDMDFDDQVLASISPDQILLKNAIERCSPNLVEKSQKAIEESAKPTHVDQLLRVSLWEELSDALKENRIVSERAIYNEVCSYSYWKSLRDGNDEKFTYLLIPIKSYARTNRLLLTLGQEALLNILEADPYVKGAGTGYKKQLDPKIAKVQLEAYKMVEERTYGKAVARIQTHSTNGESDNTGNAQETIEQLKKEIALMEGPKTFQVDV